MSVWISELLLLANVIVLGLGINAISRALWAINGRLLSIDCKLAKYWQDKAIEAAKNRKDSAK